MTEDRHQESGGAVNIHSRVNFYGQVIVIFAPLSLVGLFVFAVYVGSHWHEFIGQSSAIVSWVLSFGALCLYIALAWGAARVLLLFGRGAVDIYRNLAEARGQAMRNRLLYTADNYVVYHERGQVIVKPVTQEKVTYNIRQAAPGQIVTEADELGSLPAPVQSFHELLLAGVVQAAIAEGRMLLGYTAGILRYGSWLDLYSCGVGGVSGSGKTTTVRFLLFQALLAGARLLMVDPHIGEPEESLAAQFRAFTHAHLYRPCDDTPTEVIKRVRWLVKELARRKGTGDKTPFVIFVVDEFNAVMRVKEVRDELAALLVSIAQEGRKFGLFAMLIGQRWSHQDIGGADIRTSLASTLAHRFTDEEQAKKLVGGRNGARCLELPVGHFLFRDTNGALSEMITPYTEVDDGAFIQQLLASACPENRSETRDETSETRAKLVGNQDTPRLLPPWSPVPRNGLEMSLKTPGNERQGAADTSLQEKMQAVLRLHAEGKQKPEVIKLVWGVSPGGSQSYELANSEYQQVMRLAHEKLGA